MPRNVRPSWLEVSIDGRPSKFASGPKARKGRMRGTLFLRDAGAVGKAVCFETFERTDPADGAVRYGAEFELLGDSVTVILPDGDVRTLPRGARVRVYGAPEPA